MTDALARALYSEYCDADVGYSWFSLPEKAKNQWRRVAAYVELTAQVAARDGEAFIEVQQ